MSEDKLDTHVNITEEPSLSFMTQEFGDSFVSNLFGFDKKNWSNFTSEEKEVCDTINQSEIKAKEILRNLASDLAKNLLTSGAQSVAFGQQLSFLNLNAAQTAFITSAFDQMIAYSIKEVEKNISEQLKSQLKTQGKKLYNAILCENIIIFFESVLEFKNKIDDKFPGLSDQIIAMAVPAITSLATTYAPAIGAVLKFTNILGRGAEFLKTENLQESIKTMKSDLAQINEDRQMAAALKDGDKSAEILEKLNGVTTDVISKFNLNPETTQKLVEEISKNEDAKGLLQNICDFAKDVLPNNQGDIDEKLIAIKANILKELTHAGTSEDNINTIGAILDESISEAKSEMTKTLSSENRIFDKIAAVQQAANIINETSREIKQILSVAGPVDNVSRIITAATKEHLTKKIEPIAKEMSKDCNRKLVKDLGASFASRHKLQESIREGVKQER